MTLDCHSTSSSTSHLSEKSLMKKKRCKIKGHFKINLQFEVFLFFFVMGGVVLFYLPEKASL